MKIQLTLGLMTLIPTMAFSSQNINCSFRVSDVNTEIQSLIENIQGLDEEYGVEPPQEDERVYVCALQNNIDSDIECVDPLLFDIKSQKSYIFQCYKNGQKVDTESTYSLENAIGINIGEFLKLLNIKGSYSKTTKKTQLVYTCQNKDNGDIYSGTLTEVTKKYRDYLAKKAGQ